MVTIRLNMSPKEINEGYMAGIPENIMSKMIQGLELNDKEKDFVKSRGKVYVLGHTKYKGQTRIKPQLRDLPGGGSQQVKFTQCNPNEEKKKYTEEEIEKMWDELYDDKDEGDLMEASDELYDIGLIPKDDAEWMIANSDVVTVIINHLRKDYWAN